MPGVNALNPTTDINAVINFVNAQISGGAPIAPEDFYSLQLLETIRLDADQYIYFKMADAMPIQGKADKLIVRRWAPLQAHTVPLLEGVPPKSDKGSVVKYEMEAFQYGRYMEFTDKVDFKVVDPVVAHYSKEYSIVAIETLDLLAREALMIAAQKYYAGMLSDTDEFTFVNSVPSLDDLRKIILSLKKLLVKPRSSGKYEVIGSQEFYFDMFSDPLVRSFMTINQSTGTMYNGTNVPLPDMFDMKFLETMCVPTSGEYIDALGNKRLKYYLPNGDISTSDGPLSDLIETNPAHYALVDGFVQDGRTGQDASYIPQRPVWTLPATAREFKMQHIFILGREALARTGLSGQDSAKMYVKPLGSSGVIDPIDQRQSIGFKINSVGFASVRNEAVVDYVCVPTQVNVQ